jgi:hypothetical protein
MLLDPHEGPPKWFQVDISSSISLIVVGAIILTSISLSIVATRHERRIKRDQSNSDSSKDAAPDRDATQDKSGREESGTDKQGPTLKR